MRKAVIGVLMASTLATPLMAQGREEIRQDRREVIQGHREVNRDLRRGDYGEARRDARELREDRRELREDRADRRDDRWRRSDYVDRNWSRRGWTRDWRNHNVYDWHGYRDLNRRIFAMPRYAGPRGWTYRRYRAGVRIAPVFYSQRYWIADPWRYRLPYASGFTRWVRYGDDVLLIDTRRGIILDVIPDFFQR
jgi:Ni/Co efflux regulator RcnB